MKTRPHRCLCCISKQSSNMAANKLLTLDVTNTCIKVSSSIGTLYARHAAKYGVEVDIKEADHQFKIHYKRMCERHPNFGRYSAGMDCKEWWRQVSTSTYCQSSDVTKETVDTMSSTLYNYFTLAECWSVYEDIDILPNIKNAGYIIGVISNFDERLEVVLENLKIRQYFDFVLPSYCVGCHKPDHEIFHKALTTAETLATNACHIGDNYYLDYKPAVEIGMRSLLLQREDDTTWKDVKVIKNLREFLS